MSAARFEQRRQTGSLSYSGPMIMVVLSSEVTALETGLRGKCVQMARVSAGMRNLVVGDIKAVFCHFRWLYGIIAAARNSLPEPLI